MVTFTKEPGMNRYKLIECDILGADCGIGSLSGCDVELVDRLHALRAVSVMDIGFSNVSLFFRIGIEPELGGLEELVSALLPRWASSACELMRSSD